MSVGEKKNRLQTALKSFARNRNIKKVGHEEVRDYYDYKSAKCLDSNNNIVILDMFRSLDKPTKKKKNLKKRFFAATI
ncbi:hypothetical protein C2G38_2174361 [Gigaspora rosea]|uniref:Uncharacterized protein n=1 Tax=Gigaspora rosea TaxID=44941 RepID=A0A397VMS6_9GLOM|nr:hypothetical protein C2G38_2174361 [Gigaspora rosea]